MFTQSKTIPRQKLYTLNASPAGRELIGRIEAGKKSWQFNFTPQEARIEDWRLVLTGRVTITPPVGRPRSLDGVKARLLATQGATTTAPEPPAGIDPRLVPPAETAVKGLPLTEYTGNDGSIGVMFLKLSSLTGIQADLPFDLGSVQLNARLWASSGLERDLLWLYSAVLMATQGPQPDGPWANGLLAEINRRLGK